MKENQEIQLGSDVPRRLLLSPRETSVMIGRAEQTLANERFEGRGLPYVKWGRAVKYRLSDILAEIEARTIDPEAQRAG
jgi:hypothetical protein